MAQLRVQTSKTNISTSMKILLPIIKPHICLWCLNSQLTCEKWKVEGQLQLTVICVAVVCGCSPKCCLAFTEFLTKISGISDTLFLASMSNVATPVVPASRIIWDLAVINPGGYYSTETGGYTANFNGYYQWVFQLQLSILFQCWLIYDHIENSKLLTLH